jgi:hypothetical protein
LLAGGALFACGGGSGNDPGNTNATGGVTSAGQGGRATGGRDNASGGKTSGGGETSSGGNDSDAGESSSGGATADGGVGGADDGDAGAAQSGGTSQSTGGKGSTGGTNASGGTTSGGGGGLATGRACDGFNDRAGCRTAADCTPLQGTIEPPTCVMVQPAQGCGNPTFLPSCPEAGCPSGQVCRPLTCGEECQPACDDSTCSGTNHCVNDLCQPKPCDEGGLACPDGYECDPAATQFPTHCAPISCNDGQECDVWRTCGEGVPLDAHGCGPIACTADTDCGDCGYCVNGACEPTLGICYQLLAMPYGCVWPDEELL